MSERDFFIAALKITEPGERSLWLDQACGDDAALRRRLDVLLQAFDKAGSLLENPVAAVGPTIAQPLTEAPGTVIGPYKLLQQIGEGGMGTVFMAEQTQPMQRKVALKLIKPGMDSRQIIARFEAERQALAMMDHVNIARVFDGGTTGGEPGGVSPGRPYFVMELVHGVPITKYCDDNHLTPRERLELFVPVCNAIQHAHQKGIIHRDIKPSNVMVTLYDGKPVPKVIDFGVAKATEQKLTERTLFTQYGTMVGTLEYMSPEQAEMSALGVDTRSDIYSLGVLLYELLTGNTPLTHKRMKHAAYAEILRMIKEEEPQKPSTRLSDSGEALASISANRQMEPAKLTKLVRGELDWIVMKTLEKDRNRRYETANGLAQDVQSYLADETVTACPPSAWYRFRKFARRNKAVITSAGLVAAALVLGMAVSIWQAVRALEAERQAETNFNQAQAELAEKITQHNRADSNFRLAMQALEKTYLRVAEEELPRHLDARQKQEFQQLLLDGLQFYEAFAEQNRANRQARSEVAKAYVRAGNIRFRLGQHREAERTLSQVLGLFENSAPTAEDRYLLAECQDRLGVVFKETRRLPEAEQAFRKASDMLDKLVSEFPKVPRYRHGQALCLDDFGSLYRRTGRLPEAEAFYRRSVALLRQLVEEYSPATDYRKSLAKSAVSLAILLEETKKLDEAENLYDLARTHLETLLAKSQDPDVRLKLANCYLNQGKLLRTLKRPEEAEKGYRKGLDLMEEQSRLYPAVPDYELNVVMLTTMWADMIEDQGRLEEAEKAHRRAITRAEQLAARYPAVHDYAKFLFGAHNNLGALLEMKLHRLPEAEQAYRRALEVLNGLVKEVPAIVEYRQRLPLQYANLGDVLAKLPNRTDEADAAYQQAVAEFARLAADFPKVADHRLDQAFHQSRRGKFLREADRLPAAEQAYREALAIAQQLLDEYPEMSQYRRAVAICHRNLATALIPAGWLVEAEAAVHQAMRRCSELAGEFPKGANYRYDVVLCHHCRGDLEKAKQRPDAAKEAYQRALQLCEALAAEFPNNTEYRDTVLRLNAALKQLP